MNKFIRASGKASGVTACRLISPESASEQEFGYVRPRRLRKSGKRMLFYRLPRGGQKPAITKSLVFMLVLLLVVFAVGYANKEHVSNQGGGRVLPTAVIRDNTFHSLITISAVRGAVNSPVSTVPRMRVQSG